MLAPAGTSNSWIAITPSVSAGSIRGRIASPPTRISSWVLVVMVSSKAHGGNAEGFDDLDMAHVNLFLYPGPQGARPSALAAQRGMSKQAVNYLLGQLEALGYLERRPDAGDGRSKRIALTDRGERAAYTIRDAVRDVERDWQAQLGQDRFAQLKALLLKLNQPA